MISDNFIVVVLCERGFDAVVKLLIKKKKSIQRDLWRFVKCMRFILKI